jgi:hypothetical protein
MRALYERRLRSVSSEQPQFEVYVDEAGDRGWGGASSAVFVMSAVIVRSDADHTLRDGLAAINGSFRKPRPDTTVVHWADNVREHADRKYVATIIAGLPVTTINVVVCKTSMFGTGSGLSQSGIQYNYALRRLLERVSWYARNSGGIARVTFGHVTGLRYHELSAYLAFLRADPQCSIFWPALKNGTRPRIEQPAKVRGLQIADAVAGCVYAATRPDHHSTYESTYLETIAPTLWLGPTGKLRIYGLHFIAAKDHACPEHYPWWEAVWHAAHGTRSDPQ